MAKVKVSQKTIDNIKKMGMTKTLESLRSIGQPGSRNVPASKEFIEGARRMYGTRVDKYLPAKSSSADAARRSATSMGRSKPVAKSADAARAAATKTSSKPMAKKSGAAPKRKPATNPAAKAVVNILSGKGIGNREPKKNK